MQEIVNIQPDPDINAFMQGIVVKGMWHSLNIDYILKLLNLEVCANIVVSSNMLRGIWGGGSKDLGHNGGDYSQPKENALYGKKINKNR